MKNKIVTLALIGFLGLYMAPILLANSQGQDHRAYPEFKPLHATDVEIVKKASLAKTQKGKPADKPGKPPKDEEPSNTATGILGDEVLGNRYAIVIGISDYLGLSDLNYTDNDAVAMREVLDDYGFMDENIYLLTDGDGAEEAIQKGYSVYGLPNAQNIYNAIVDLRDERGLTPDDEVVFFYSGHGGKGRANDGDKEAIDESIISHNGTQLVHIWDGQLKQWFENYATNRIVFFFDSCVSGGMTDLAGEGRIINMATQEKRFDTAVELESLGYGEFTYYFVVEGIGLGFANTNPVDEYVTVEEAFDYAKANVAIDHPTVSDGFELDLAL